MCEYKEGLVCVGRRSERAGGLRGWMAQAIGGRDEMEKNEAYLSKSLLRLACDKQE